MADHIKIRQANGTWVVRAGGAVIAESNVALELTEGDLPPVIYFPRGDIAMAFLDATDETKRSAEMGEARYFTVVAKSATLENAAWSYEDPAEAEARIKDHIAFSTAKVTVEQL
ncbi:MAG: DUF427 domain-containing protein [Pseudomonadota bacterium]